MFILSTIFSALAGISNAFMDLSAENRFIDNKFNKSEGPNNDENKWKQPLEPGKRIWWYLWLKKPMYKESFIWSSTLLVKFTDWWHRFQAFMIVFFCLAIVFYSPFSSVVLAKLFGWKLSIFWTKFIDVVWLGGIFGFAFENVYAPLKKKLIKKKEELRKQKKKR
jgi:hypothetical protein